MNILVLGSQGFIGNYIVEFFKNIGEIVTGCDLVEYSGNDYIYHKVSILSSDFDNIISENNFDVCINASGSGNVSYSISHPLSDFDSNTLAVAKVLDTIRKYQPSCKYVHISSAAVYGNPTKLPINEYDVLKPMSPYGYHKYLSEIICKEYFELYNVPVAIIRPFSVYGNRLKKQLIWDICQKLNQIKSISLFGTGNETRDFIHVTDLVELISLVIKKGTFKCDIYNGAVGLETSISQIAEVMLKNFPGEKSISFSGEVKKGDPINWRADVELINQLGFVPSAKLDDKLVEYINWYCSLAHD